MNTTQTPFDVVIPARLASQRLPGKMLATIGDLPMVVRVAKRAALSGCQRLDVATDSSEIARVCQAHGISAIMTADHIPSGSDRVYAAITDRPKTRIIVNVQGDEPFINPTLIRAVAEQLAQSKAFMATAACPLTDKSQRSASAVVKVVLDQHGNALYFSRAVIPFCQTASTTNAKNNVPYWQHIGIYAYTVESLGQFVRWPRGALEQIEALEQLRVLEHGQRITVYQTDKQETPGIDTAEDLALAQAYAHTNRI